MNVSKLMICIKQKQKSRDYKTKQNTRMKNEFTINWIQCATFDLSFINGNVIENRWLKNYNKATHL